MPCARGLAQPDCIRVHGRAELGQSYRGLMGKVLVAVCDSIVLDPFGGTVTKFNVAFGEKG